MSVTKNQTNKISRRPTIGVIVDSMGSGYQTSLWDGIKTVPGFSHPFFITGFHRHKNKKHFVAN